MLATTFTKLSVAFLAASAAGIHWTAPASWQAQPARPMRAATYTVGNAECAVYYFGPHEGGSVDANIKRWIGQFQQTNGKPAPAHTATRTVNGVRITTVDVSGGYSGMGGPMAQTHPVMPHYRLLGAIADAPGGLVFFKFVGPEKTVTANQANFNRLLASIHK